MAGAVKRKITQETFDEAVKENVDDLGMEPEEALSDAIEAFEMQGVDLSNIRKTLVGEGGRAELRVVAKCTALAEALGGPPEALEAALRGLLGEITGDDAEDGAVPAAGCNGAVESVVAAVRSAAGSAGVVGACADVVAALSPDEDNRAFIATRKLDEALVGALEAAGGDALAAEAACRGCLALSSKHEEGKAGLVKCGAVPLLGSVLQAHMQEKEVASSALRALRSLCTGDDPKHSASSAFANGRALFKSGVHLALLAAAGSHESDESFQTLAASALKAAAVNEEVCKDLAEHGGVQAAVAVAGRAGACAPLARQALLLLRQLAKSDANKEPVVQHGGLAVLLGLLAAHPGAPAVAEAGLSLLAALSLRNPSGCAAAAEAGCIDAAVDAMGAHPATAAVQRQGCMYLRNTVVRNKDLIPAVLEKGAEALIRKAKVDHGKWCIDVGSAALRDLGCDNYNEGWKIDTVVMGADGCMRTADELETLEEGDVEASGLPQALKERMGQQA